MNSTLAETAPRGPGSEATPVATRRRGGVLLTLVRREFWEHRALWLAPLVVAALLALCATIGRVHIDLDDAPHFASGSQQVALFSIIQFVLAMPLYIVIIFVGSFYLLDCLYAERKDRSILFWKSLPVSDGLTVCAKLLVGLVIVPFGVFALALVAHLVFTAILGARVALGSLPPVITWNSYEWLRTEAVMLLATLFAVLWYAPIAGYLLLVSAGVRRAPILWATLPFVLAPVLEWVAFGTRYLLGFINYRVNGIWGILGVGHLNIISKHRQHHPVGTALEVLDFRGALTALDLWLGLAVTAALVYAAVRIRRYRDDT
jgi:ABC-2 type transport system permease protein